MKGSNASHSFSVPMPTSAYFPVRLSALALLLLGACWPGPRIGDPINLDDPSVNPEQVPFSQIEAQIFARSCGTSSCHEGASPRDAPMSLDIGRAYSNLVSVRAVQAPMPRVAKGDPSNSYLLYKLHGTAGTVTGIATRMPLNSPPLPPESLSAIEAWINRGAPND